MFLLNDLKDFFLYNKRIISGIDKSDKNNKKDIAFIVAGMSNDDINPLYNNIVYKNNFKSFYIPYRVITTKSGKNVLLKQTDIYTEVKEKLPGIITCRRDIDMYKNLNLIYDLSYETKICMPEYKINGLKYIQAYLNFLSIKYQSVNYKNKIIAVPIPDNYSLSGVTISNNENPFVIIYLAMIKGLIPGELEGATFLFYTKRGSFVKFKYNKQIKKADLLRAFNKASKVSKTNAEVREDEAPSVPAEVSAITSNVAEDKLSKEDNLDNLKTSYLKKIGVSTDTKIGDNLQNNIDDLNELIDTKIGSLDIDFDKLTIDDLSKMIMTDKDILKQSKIVSDLAVKGKVNDVYAEKLKTKQDDIVFNGKTLSDIVNSVQNLAIEDKIMENKNIINPEVKNNKILNFDKTYQSKQMEKDMINIFTSFNEDEDIRLFVKDIKSENTSDIFTKKMTYTVTFQDENKNQHTFKINYPILKDGKFIVAGGGRKLILKQLMLYPIVKTKSDTVQITSNYNKIFVYRFGEKLTDGTEFIKKLLLQNLDDYILKGSKFHYRRGNTSSKNKGKNISLEYGELSKNFAYIENKDYSIKFVQNDILKTIESMNIKEVRNNQLFPIGFNKNTNLPIYCNYITGEIFDHSQTKLAENLTLFIVDNILTTSLVEDKMKEFYSFNPNKTLAYNRARVTGRTIPIIILLSYEKGLKNILDRYDISYEFVKTARLNKEFGKKRIKFQDGFLTYSSLDLKATLLLDGLTLIDTENYSFNQMNTKEPYIEYFADVHGSRNIGKGIHNMLSLMIDPITKEILMDLELPTNIIDIILYANTLLATSNYKVMNDMSSYRLRGAEQVNAVLYKILADAFKTYKDTSNNGNPIKISVDPDILFKQLNALKTVDEYSILNPSLEVDKGASVTYKGPSGKLCPIS